MEPWKSRELLIVILKKVKMDLNFLKTYYFFSYLFYPEILEVESEILLSWWTNEVVPDIFSVDNWEKGSDKGHNQRNSTIKQT